VTATLTSKTAAATSSSSSTAPSATSTACQIQFISTNPWGIPLSSVSDFTGSSIISSQAKDAATPKGYQNVFKNSQAAIAVSENTFVGIADLLDYDTSECASLCDGTSGCVGFNTYFERDPSREPGQNCQNPTAGVNVKCSLWGQVVESGQATYTGEKK
jgi:hypothetical protein